MVIWLGRGDVISSLFKEDLSKVSIFWQEGDFEFHLFDGDGESSYCGEFSHDKRVWKEVFAVTLEDSVDKVIIQGVLEVLVLCIMV